jgi:AcrR family transcriptional regulator
MERYSRSMVDARVSSPETKRLPAENSLQQARVALSRDAVVAAADRLFVEHGYVGTSVSAIAREAGVAIQTVYNTVGSKADILSAVLDAHAQGPHAPRSVPEFMAERTNAADDAHALVGVLADWFVEVHQRTAVVFGIIRQAAAVDPAAAALERRRADRRRSNYLGAAASLRQLGALPPGRPDEDTAAAIFALGHPDTYRALVLDGGWSLTHYRDWLCDCLTGALLTSPTPPTPPPQHT